MRNLNGMWEFNSDYYQSPGAPVPGGFYPAEEAPAASAMDSERLPAAESRRKAEGPTFFCPDYPGNSASKSPLGFRTVDEKEGFMKSDLICNGPGWNGGIDCEGLFLSGSELWAGAGMTDVGIQVSEALGITWHETGWGWSCETFATPRGWIKYKEHTETMLNSTQGGSHRWISTDGKADDDSRILTGAGRNQHFCAEIHTRFSFRHGLKFSLSGDDDIWAFIDNKLAVDIGGMHLPAPGYVDLDKFMPNGIVGKVYDLDIYFCDRRTTMSNFSIKTNMFLGINTIEIVPPGSKISTKRIVASKAFRVNAVAPHEIEISLENNANATKQYAIMDMKGQVLSIGSLSGGNTRVKVPTSGSYIVKVGHECKRINMR
jgi:fibro-slime domain-containing protein